MVSKALVKGTSSEWRRKGKPAVTHDRLGERRLSEGCVAAYPIATATAASKLEPEAAARAARGPTVISGAQAPAGVTVGLRGPAGGRGRGRRAARAASGPRVSAAQPHSRGGGDGTVTSRVLRATVIKVAAERDTARRRPEGGP